VSRSSRYRAQRSAPRSRFSFVRKPWLIAYLIAVVGTAIVGISTAPSAPTAAPALTSLLSEEKAASFALAAEKSAAPRRGFIVASVAFTPVGGKFGHNWYERLAGPGAGHDVAGAGFKPRADAPAKSASAERTKAKKTRVTKALEVPLPEPAPERFAGTVTPLDPNAPVLLAYADPSPSAAGGVLDAMAAAEPGLAGADDEAAALPIEDGLLPDDVPLPESRPKLAKPKAEEPVAEKPAEPEQAEKPAKKPGRAVAAAKPEIDGTVADMIPGSSTPRGTGTKLAFAKPDKPAEDSNGGGMLGGLFGNKPRAGGGVAVYDISAARVYMPDGSVLEAHSGIGKMADNPRYVHVKMNGPTPPHTYVLRMREKRFHGVEAIRMIPIDGKNKHGRDGFLTHSYLLRSRLPQSHGCVAFKDYPKFLAAFKAGKVKTLVVVAGGGRKAATQVAKNGDGV
jgi:hypothetical protein